MPNEISHLISKARSNVRAIAQLTKTNLTDSITTEFAEDFNNLLTMTTEALPDDLHKYLPRPAKIEGREPSGRICDTPYVEVLAHCENIVRLLESTTPDAIPVVVN